MSDQSLSTNTRIGFAGGIICCILSGVNFADIVKTIILAIVGTIVSVTVSLLFNHILKKWRT